MSLIDRIFKKKSEEPPQPIRESLVAVEEAQTPATSNTITEIASLLTNHAQSAIEAVAPLARDPKAYMLRYREWADSMGFDSSDEADRFRYFVSAFAFILCGYSVTGGPSPEPYGLYIDYNEAWEDIAYGLARISSKLGYGLEFSQLPITGADSAQEALLAVSRHLSASGYELINLETEGEGYHLFIVPQADCPRAIELASRAAFRLKAF